MCGIAGILNFDCSRVQINQLKKMTNAIAHRGPDGEGLYVDDFIGLGHRRLAIMDLTTAGNQPMATDDSRFVITFNGELFNFKEIRLELVRLGYRFRSNSDTEVVLNAWREWGSKAVLRFNGMFAFAIWDSWAQELNLVRDRYGIKPLYVHFSPKSVIFASEQRAILTNRTVKRVLNEEAVIEYFTFQNLITNQTFSKNIDLVPPANVLAISADGQRNSWQYWDYDFSESQDHVSEIEYREELSRLFEQAVRRQLQSDVEVGAYLSGGIDSGAVTAIASQSIAHLKTFTCGFDLGDDGGVNKSFDERENARIVARKFGTVHSELVIGSGDMENCLDQVIRQLEEPRIGQSYPNFLVSRFVSKSVKVVLSGAGGDEMFGGYPWRYAHAKHDLTLDEFIDEHFRVWHRLSNFRTLDSLLSPIRSRVSDFSTREILANIVRSKGITPSTREEFVNRCLYFEARTFLHSLLIVEDKLSMAHGLETRVPFLDNDLVNFAMKCPVGLKIHDHSLGLGTRNALDSLDFKRQSGASNGKQILRAAMRKHLPPSRVHAAKQGFASPDAEWFRENSASFLKRRLSRKSSPLFDYLDFQTTQSLLNAHQQGIANQRLIIWSLLSFESLLRELT